MLEREGWRPEGRDDLIIRKAGDEWLLYDPAADDMHVLDFASALVWSFCTGDQGVEAIVAEFSRASKETDSPADVQEILDEFQAAGLFVEE